MNVPARHALLASNGDDREVGPRLANVADRVQGGRVKLVSISEESTVNCRKE